MKLLIATDLSDSTAKVIKNVLELAKSLSAEMWLIHVVEPDPDIVGITARPQSDQDIIAEKISRDHRELQEIAKEIRNQGLTITALQVQGPTVEMILNEALELEVDIIVIGSHGRGAVYELLVGSVSSGVLKKARCPVLVIPTHECTK
jgi:nucleotide-binding universal stress UspA family protein